MTVMTLFALAAMGCVGNVNSDSTNVGVDPDDTSDPENYVTVDVTIHASIDGEPIDPVGVCIHEATEDVGNEATLAPAEVTGKAIPVTVFQGGEAVRPWIGPATSAKSSDGYRVLEFDGRKWVHPLADFLVSAEGCGDSSDVAKMISPDYCEPTVALNGYLPKAEYHCEMSSYEYDASASDYKGKQDGGDEGDHVLEVTSGKDIIDVDENGLDGFLSNGCKLESSGSSLTVTNCEIGDMHVISSAWLDNGFTISSYYGDHDFVQDYTCTVK